MKKKIIFFCPSIEIGGVEKNLYKVVNFFSSKNEDVSLITFNKKRFQKKFNKKVKVISNNFLCKFNFPYFIKTLLCIIYYFFKYGFQKDLILVSFQSNLYFILLAKLTRNKIVARSNAAPNYYVSNQFKQKFFQLIYNLADKVIVNSNEFKNIFFKTFKVMPILIYNPAFNKSKAKSFRKIKKFKKNKIIKFLNVGRLTYQKNQMIILQALCKINYLNYKLIIIGNGTEEENLKKYILLNNLQNKVQILKNISDASKYFKKCDAFILSSKFEGLPNVLIEAQIMKKFILSSKCPTGPSEILMNGRAGYLFRNNDYKDLKNKIQKFVLKINKSEIKNKIKIGYKNLYRFDENKNLEKYYKEIITL